MANEKRRLIDANALRLAIRDDAEIVGKHYARIKMHINGAPPVDAVEVAHGWWIQECKNRRRCSNCQHGRNTDTQIGWNYCPNCGAKMDGERGDEE